MTRVRAAIVPAAGLGTRLHPLTLGVAKELLPLGGHPALAATLLEAAAAHVFELAVVVSPKKEGVRRFLEGFAFARRFQLHIVEQPEPAGVLDAVERGLKALGAAPDAAAVLFPDLVHLPDQTALARLVAAHAQVDKALFGLRFAAPGDLATPTAAVRLAEDLDPHAAPPDRPLRIAEVRRATGAAGELLTTFGQIQTAAMGQAIEACCRRPGEALLDDGGLLVALNRLAAAGELYGLLLPGAVLDLGTLPGYLDASRRFLSGAAHLRELP